MEELLKEYEDVFTGLGCLPVQYHVEVDPAIKLRVASARVHCLIC